MTFSAQPHGFFEHINHTQNQIELINDVLRNEQYKYKTNRFCILTDRNFKVIEKIEISDMDDCCVIDHPVMILARKFANQNNLNNNGFKLGDKRPMSNIDSI